MRALSIENILSVCKGSFYGDAALLSREISAVTTDSRNISCGCLFAAMVGERADGHDYIPAAWEMGALCCIGEKKPEELDGAFILVDSTLAALQAIAAFYRKQFDIPFVGITGSVGKTTVKEMIAAVLAQKYNVHKTAGNFNNELGVPLTLFGLKEEHSAAVVEMGISHFGEMRVLTDIVRPDYGVFTVIGYSHLEHLGDRAGVLRAKKEMLEGIPENGKIFCCGDDDILAVTDFGRQKISYGLGNNCTVRAENVHLLPSGETACTILAPGRCFEVRIKAYGEHMVTAALAGSAVGIELGLSDEQISAGIASFETVGSRSRLIKTEKFRIIDDCYNSNPSSLSSALRSLADMNCRRVAVLGDMLELGEKSSQLHYECGALAARLGIDLVLTAGEQAKNMALGAGDIARHFEKKADLISKLPGLIRPGDAVLVKASRGMHFEEISSLIVKM